MAKKSKAGGSSLATNVDPDTLIARAPGWRWQRGCEAEEVLLDSGSKRRTQRVFDAVRGLAKSGRIDGSHTTAAERWTRDFEWSMRSSWLSRSVLAAR